MNPTEILRAELSERGVRWWQKKRHTCWKVSKGQEVEMWRAWEAPDGSLTLKVDYIYGLTPEQAIAATLGPGTCKPITYDNGYSMDRVDPGDYYEFWEPACACGNCGELIPMRKFCPNCGCRLEVDA